jgi:hypothetical protein
MSFVSAIFPSGLYGKNWKAREESGLVRQLCKASQILRDMRIQLRFGKLSRAPIRLLRLQMLEDSVECDWLARAPDPWDADLSRKVQQRHTSLQALRDAIDVRALLFGLLPQVETAYFRVFRESLDYRREMIITGCAQRNDQTSRDVHSIVMRAKVLGFHFDIEGDTLREITGKESVCAVASPN